MARGKKDSKRQIDNYVHTGRERLNNPPVGLVTPDTDKDAGKRTYAYDPHLDPQLVWAGKAEHTSFKVPTVSLHVHERIDPLSIVEAVKRRNGSDPQLSLFAAPEENRPIRHAIEFYKHAQNWTNRLIAGDSLLVMNSLLEKEGMAGKVQMIYIDPPYGIRYGSNFQPFVNKRDVKDGKDEDLNQEPEMIKAFRDTWELGIHSYLTYLRDRLLLARELLHESGSCFVQISDENLHHVREVMDDVFRVKNFVGLITFKTGSGFVARYLKTTSDYLIWYAKDTDRLKFHRLFVEKPAGADTYFDKIQLPSGEVIDNGPGGIPDRAELVALRPLVSSFSANTNYRFTYQGREYYCGNHRAWKTTRDGMERLINNKRIYASENTLKFIARHRDFPFSEVTHVWDDTMELLGKSYAVQTTTKVLQRCLLLTTDPGDLVLDPTCGSGTTAHVAEQWGRRWITCDTSRVALALAKQRLMTAVFDYYELAHPKEGVASGFTYKTVPHVTLKSIAKNEPPPTETLYDQPLPDKKKTRVTGPFTVEAVPAPAVKPLDEVREAPGDYEADAAIARTGETRRQGDWRDELLRTGIRGKSGQRIEFSRVEALAGTRWLHADAETKEDKPQRVVVSFGPEHAPLEQRQVALAIEEAQQLVPKPRMIVFAAFQFDPEASKDIDETNWPGVTLLKAQMNADLLTEDLKKKRASNESFWLIGQPDVSLEEIRKGEDAGKYRVTVNGFDYYNTRTGEIESGGSNKIAMWMLDHDYDGRSLFPRQVFFPMAGDKDGWAKLAKNLKAEIDEELIEAYRGTVSLPFSAGDNRRAAVKIIDDRGIESLKVIGLR